MKSRLRRAVPLLLLAAYYFSLEFWWFVGVPLGRAPDEPDHVDYVNWLVRERSLPRMLETKQSAVTAMIRWNLAPGHVYRFDESDPRKGRGEDFLKTRDDNGPWVNDRYAWLIEAGQPPLAYLIPAAILGPVRHRLTAVTNWQLIRLFSVAAGFGAVLAGWHLGRRLWPRAPDAGGLALALWMAGLPSAAFVRAVASNDALAGALAAWCFCALCLRRRADLRTALLLGAIVGAALLAKASALFLMPGVIVWAACARGPRLARLGFALLALAAAAIPLAAYAFVFAIPQGAWHYFDFADLTFDALKVPMDALDAWRLVLHDIAVEGADGFFGRYDWNSLARPLGEQVLSTVVVAAGILGAFLAPRGTAPHLARTGALAAMLLAALLAMMAWAGYENAVRCGSTTLQGRHLLVAQLPVGVLLLAGWGRLLASLGVSARHAPLLAAGLLGGLAVALAWNDVFNVLCWQTFGAQRPVMAELAGRSTFFEHACAWMPGAAKHPAIFKAAYALHAASVVALFAVLGTALASLQRRVSARWGIAIGALAGLNLLIWLGL